MLKTYEIWATQGQGECFAKRFARLEDALKYVEEHEKEASFGIKYPDDTWHDWNDPKASPK